MPGVLNSVSLCRAFAAQVFVLVRSLMGLLVIALVPLLVPKGTPQDTVQAMGSSIGGEHATSAQEHEMSPVYPKADANSDNGSFVRE